MKSTPKRRLAESQRTAALRRSGATHAQRSGALSGKNTGRDAHQQRPVYSAAQVISVADIPAGKLTDWIAQGLATPSVRVSTGTGTDHLFSLGDLHGFAALGRLHGIGFPIKRAGAVMRHVAALARGNCEHDYLVVFPDGTFAGARAAELDQVLDDQAAPVTVLLHLPGIHERVAAATARWALSTPPRRGRRSS